MLLWLEGVNMNLKSKSIKNKIFLAIVYSLIIQEVLFIFTITKGSIINEIRDNAFSSFENKVNKESLFVQTQMEKYWGDLDDTQEDISNYIEQALFNKKILPKEINKNEELSLEILSDISNKLLFILKKNYVTGAYLILDTENEEENNILKNGIYIKDINPQNTAANNSDLLLCVGGQGLEKKLKITRSPHCIEKYQFNQNEWNYNEVVRKPIEIAKSNFNNSNMNIGYWGKDVNLCNSQNKSITYSVPIIDTNKNIYGVLGIELTNDYIQQQIDEYGISEELDSFILAYDSNNDLEFKSISIFNYKLSDKEEAPASIKIGSPLYNDIYEVVGHQHGNEKLYACIKPLNFNNDSEEAGKWAIIGIKNKSQLFYYQDKIRFIIYMSGVISTTLAIVLALIIGNRITNPIKRLVGQVKQSDPKDAISLDEVNITEIDDLSKEIMNLSARSIDSASKLSQILELLNMPIGAFEYEFGKEEIFCTKGFFYNLGMESEFWDKESIDIFNFDDIMREIINSPDEEKNIYSIEVNGNTKYIKLSIKSDEIKVLGVINDVTQDILKRKEIEYERDYDILTNLLNRLGFRNNVEDVLRKKACDIAAIITINLDNLKIINNNFSYELGDEYIKAAARILLKYKSDETIICRRSADEFVIFTYKNNNKDSIKNLIKDIHFQLKRTDFKLSDEKSQKIRSTFGVTWYPIDSMEYDELCRYSEFTAIKTKKTAKGTIGYFDIEEYNKVYNLLNRGEDLNKLIENELIEYAFQPIIDIHTGKIFAYEALMRSKMESIRSPLEIIQIATSESKLYEIEKLTMFKGLEFYCKNKEYFNGAKLFINSLPNCLLTNEDIDKLEFKYKNELQNIVLELLENEQSDKNVISDKIKKIKEWNAKLAIDDFGSGYNNESVLLDITPDFVKIDMDIVQGVEHDINRRKIIKNLTSYAKSREIKVIAEGIETREQLECVLELGVDYVQGYYFSRPTFIPQKLKEEVIVIIKEINEKNKKC